MTLFVTYADYSYADSVFSTLQTKGENLFTNVRNITFIGGGLGLIGIAVMGYFGRFNFKWLFASAGGLILAAVAGSAITYLVSNENGGTTATMPNWSDTLTTQ